ncbi:MAG TPA: lipopolysaccharide biosynthesis protein [Pirellulales bacterium]|jgi:O-antigen/teichoic acid export membrane protein|nr:lipopolysaccharide biosynthesis protein [Pirellulales bacterium]
MNSVTLAEPADVAARCEEPGLTLDPALPVAAPASPRSMADIPQPIAVEIPAATSDAPQIDAPQWRTDTLAQSLAILLALSVVQRLIGFARQVMVCRWLEPAQLGEWDIALKFLMLAAPVSVLGLPGSFGRYMEHYRRRGHLKTLLRRTAAACIVLSAVSTLGIAALRTAVSELIYGTPNHTGMVVLLAMSLLTVIAYNYLTEMLTALRMVRVASIVQLVNTVLFAVLSVALVFGWQCDAAAIVAAYALSAAILIGPILVWFRRTWRQIPEPVERLSHSALWGKLVPFAMSVWAVNLLYNLVGVVDRYMIVHYAPAAEPLALVGDYHSSQVVPMLMVSVSGIVGGILLPYLSHDWEAGDQPAVAAKLNLAIKVLGIAMFAGSAVVLLASPLLFGVAFHGKFDGGLAILPWTLTYCIWMALVPLAQMYLWCAERARLPAFALVAGLIANVMLCRLLLPAFGLHGVVWATCAANLVTLAIMFQFNRAFGMRIHGGTWLVILLPLLLGLGKWAVVAVTLVLFMEILTGERIFTRADKQQFTATCRHYIMNRIFKSAATPSENTSPKR